MYFDRSSARDRTFAQCSCTWRNQDYVQETYIQEQRHQDKIGLGARFTKIEKKEGSISELRAMGEEGVRPRTRFLCIDSLGQEYMRTKMHLEQHPMQEISFSLQLQGIGLPGRNRSGCQTSHFLGSCPDCT